jgi:hypothetical protein
MNFIHCNKFEGNYSPENEEKIERFVMDSIADGIVENLIPNADVTKIDWNRDFFVIQSVVDEIEYQFNITESLSILNREL